MNTLLSCAFSTLLLASVAFNGAGCAATATRQSTGEYIDDTAITAKVKTALIKDDTVKAADVQVETFRGNVQLSGFVDTAVQKARAAQVAQSVTGVTNVTNNIQLKANQP